MPISAEPTFRQRLEALPREDLLGIIREQNPNIIKEIRRIEWVFENKLQHLNWPDGTPILGRPLTNEELALLIDEPFTPDHELTRLGISLADQRRLYIAKDPIMWARNFLEAEPRAYQILILRHPGLRKVLRAGRRLGKTWTMAIVLLHYSYTHNYGRCVVVAPMKTQVEIIYQEILRLSAKNGIVSSSITRKVTSPQFAIEFSNGSTVRFFTSGIKSGGKADVVRGQEAHIIVLDELDYMHGDDLESLYAMLQKTAEDQPDKILIGASTPTGARSHFWDWCHASDFREFWFPSYCNPFFEKKDEEFFHDHFTEMGYRHEVEADWGEDVQGVYPRKYVDAAVVRPGWEYKADVNSARSFFVFGVDWDKFGAGTSIVVLEVCQDDYEVQEFQGKIRLAFREETPKEEFTLTNAVARIIELNKIFNPRFIYVDRGFGEVQVELLLKHGIEHPESQLRKRVVGVQFSETLELPDPVTKQMIKKDIKPFMVDNLRQFLEKGLLFFPELDEELYMQLISYVVARVTPTGRPVFEMNGSNVPDHAHDALILACLAITQNYGDLMRVRLARKGIAVSSDTFLPMFEANEQDEQIAEAVWGSKTGGPIFVRRAMSVSMGRINTKPFKRKSF